MGYQHILYDVAGRIATVSLDRPERLNAWTLVMERAVPKPIIAAINGATAGLGLVTARSCDVRIAAVVYVDRWGGPRPAC